MLADITLFQAITLAVAVLGAALGVINTWHNLDKAKVKLVVRPRHAIPVGSADPDINFCIEVTNLSSFAVTVHDVGFFLRGTDTRAAITNPFLIDNGPWPRRLESRSSVTVYCKAASHRITHPIKSAYAKTACGHIETATSAALKQLASQLERGSGHESV